MSWSTLTANQWITFQDAIESPFNKHYPITGSNKFMTKDEVINYLDIIHSNLDGLTSSQYVTNQVLSSATV